MLANTLENPICEICGERPCDVAVFCPQLNLDPNVAVEDYKNRRWVAYTTYIRLKYGVLGRGNRVVIPQCVRDKIRETWPAPDGKYTNHRDV